MQTNCRRSSCLTLPTVASLSCMRCGRMNRPLLCQVCIMLTPQHHINCVLAYQTSLYSDTVLTKTQNDFCCFFIGVTQLLTQCLICSVFTARGYAKRGICRRRVFVCVCVSVCLSVTLRYCIKMAKRRITQTTPQDSPMTLVF